MVFAWLTEQFSSGNPWFYTTFYLTLVLILLTLLYLLKKVVFIETKKRLKTALKSTGVEIIEEPERKTSILPSLSFFKKGPVTSDDNVDIIANRLHEIIEEEKALKNEERKVTKVIKELYRKASKIDDSAVQDKKVEEAKNVPKGKSELLDDDVKKVLLTTDTLLEKLPHAVIDEFVNSPEFETYKKVIEKAKK
jgi:hypothetical protein